MDNKLKNTNIPQPQRERPWLLPTNRKLRHLHGLSIRNLVVTNTPTRSRGKTIDDESLPNSLQTPAKLLSRKDAKKLEHSRSFSDLPNIHKAVNHSSLILSPKLNSVKPRRRSMLEWAGTSLSARPEQLGDVVKKTMADTFFSLHCAGLEEPLYISEIVMKTTNPDFQSFDLTTCVPQTRRSDEITVKVWAKSEVMSNYAFILEMHLHLASLQFIGKALEGFRQPLPPNCVIFHLTDGIYTSFMDMPSEGNIQSESMRVQQKEPDHETLPTSSYDSLMRLRNLDDCIQDALAIRSKLTLQINEILQENEKSMSMIDGIYEQKEKVLQVQRLVRHQREEVRLARLKRDKLYESIATRKRALIEGQIAHQKAKEYLESNQEKLMECRVMDKNMSDEISGQLRRICEDIQSIYPIEPVPNKPLSFTIAGLPLPTSSSFEDVDEEVTAAALGHVAHVVHLLGLYLSIPLYYPIRPYSSNSYIQDPISVGIQQRTYPLHPSGKYRFEYGVFLLNKDIELLINRQGMKVLDIRHTLPNLKYLLYLLTTGEGELPARKAGSLRGFLGTGITGTANSSRRASQESTDSEIAALARRKLENEGRASKLGKNVTNTSQAHEDEEGKLSNIGVNSNTGHENLELAADMQATTISNATNERRLG